MFSTAHRCQQVRMLQLSHPHRAFHRAGQTYMAVARTYADALARSRLHGERPAYGTLVDVYMGDPLRPATGAW
jgi:hypothetical protein